MKTYRYTISFFLVVLAFSSSCKSQLNTAVLDDIYKKQKSEFGDNVFIKSLKNYRMQFLWLDKLDHSNKNDTIYILEFPGVQGNCNFTFWNRIDTISYTNETGSFEFVTRPLFTKRMLQLVSDWDIEGIKEGKNINSNLLPNEIIYATRVVFSNKKYKIDCIHFKDFFNMERDGMDFSN